MFLPLIYLHKVNRGECAPRIQATSSRKYVQKVAFCWVINKNHPNSEKPNHVGKILTVYKIKQIPVSVFWFVLWTDVHNCFSRFIWKACDLKPKKQMKGEILNTPFPIFCWNSKHLPQVFGVVSLALGVLLRSTSVEMAGYQSLVMKWLVIKWLVMYSCSRTSEKHSFKSLKLSTPYCWFFSLFENATTTQKEFFQNNFFSLNYKVIYQILINI